MKAVRTLALVGAGLGAAALATGFPKRIGLTASEAAVSLPGDLLLPTASVVVDRGIRIDAPAHAVWSVLEAAFEDEDESRLVAAEADECLILRVPAPGLDDEEPTGTCVLALLPLPNGRTLLHLRERHVSREDAPDAVLYAILAAESFSTMRMLLDIRAAVSRA
ncbi:hypothetical protein [Actinomyces culturomici]|uniref:hypothetical protein n=1 Tax=Actinomyces culturomici TaxID=1926276 RepID=UPI000E2003BD|nr:hypothetical protein [Actinomyces culturomici]